MVVVDIERLTVEHKREALEITMALAKRQKIEHASADIINRCHSLALSAPDSKSARSLVTRSAP